MDDNQTENDPKSENNNENDKKIDKQEYDDNENENELIEQKPVTWVDRFYSAFVESLSTVDLITDSLVLIQLYKSNHLWWTTLMVLMIVTPYLVSFSVLGTLFQKKLAHSKVLTISGLDINNNNININNNNGKKSCKGVFLRVVCLLLMTPLSLLYFILIDILFMVYITFASLIFFIIRKDISHYIDQFTFEKVLSMNRMQIIGYRRKAKFSFFCLFELLLFSSSLSYFMVCLFVVCFVLVCFVYRCCCCH